MKITDYCKAIAGELKNHLNIEKENLRRVQIRGFEKLIKFVLTGKLSGLIKQPTGAGKTRFFGEILVAINMPSLVLVPRINLVNDTKDELVGAEERDIEGLGFLDDEVLILQN